MTSLTANNEIGSQPEAPDRGAPFSKRMSVTVSLLLEGGRIHKEKLIPAQRLCGIQERVPLTNCSQIASGLFFLLFDGPQSNDDFLSGLGFEH
jgi:hypothetical protein